MNTIDQLFATLPANVRDTVEDLVDDHGWALHAIPLPACADALNAVLAAGHILTRCVPVDARRCWCVPPIRATRSRSMTCARRALLCGTTPAGRNS